jgi:hypothetical protein
LRAADGDLEDQAARLARRAEERFNIAGDHWSAPVEFYCPSKGKRGQATEACPPYSSPWLTLSGRFAFWPVCRLLKL